MSSLHEGKILCLMFPCYNPQTTSQILSKLVSSGESTGPPPLYMKRAHNFPEYRTNNNCDDMNTDCIKTSDFYTKYLGTGVLVYDSRITQRTQTYISMHRNITE